VIPLPPSPPTPGLDQRGILIGKILISESSANACGEADGPSGVAIPAYFARIRPRSFCDLKADIEILPPDF